MLEGKNISFKYKSGEPLFENITISIKQGERVGLVAKSGYGKSTLAKILAGFIKPQKGEVLIGGKPISKGDFNPVQLIYQHPEKAINPRWKLREVLEEGGVLEDQLIEEMGIERNWLNRYPNELSSGELQRFCIARSLGKDIRFLIADEITTMLDAISQAQIWSSILKIIDQRNIGLLMITHNIHLANRICTRTIDLERMTEIGK